MPLINYKVIASLRTAVFTWQSPSSIESRSNTRQVDVDPNSIFRTRLPAFCFKPAFWKNMNPFVLHQIWVIIRINWVLILFVRQMSYRRKTLNSNKIYPLTN